MAKKPGKPTQPATGPISQHKKMAMGEPPPVSGKSLSKKNKK